MQNQTRKTYPQRLIVAVTVSLLSSLSFQATATNAGNTTVNTAIESLRSKSIKTLTLHRQANTGTIRFLRTDLRKSLTAQSMSGNDEERARAFLVEYKDAFTRDPLELQVLRAKLSSASTIGFVHFQQTIQGIPVRGGEALVRLNDSGVTSVISKLQSDLVYTDTTPDIDDIEAAHLALDFVQNKYNKVTVQVESPKLEIFNEQLLLGQPGSGDSVLSWFVNIIGDGVFENVWVDAHNGAVLKSYSDIKNAFDVYINLYNKSQFVFSRDTNSGAVGNANVDLGFNNAQSTYNYFSETFGRDGYGNDGLLIVLNVEDPVRTSAWVGKPNKIMYFGPGYSQADDIVAHEYTHGVIESTANLNSIGEAGIIAESLGDIFGELVDQYNVTASDTPANKWEIGEDVPGITSAQLRNMLNPEKYNQPAKISDTSYYCGDDNTLIHKNNGVSNHAFALLSEGGSFNGLNITAIGTAKAAKIYYKTMTEHLISNSTFIELSNLLALSCDELQITAEVTKDDCNQLIKALAAVELLLKPCNTQLALCPAGQQANHKFYDDLETPGEPARWTSQTLSGNNHWLDPLGRGTESVLYHLADPGGNYPTSGKYSFWAGTMITGSGDSTVEMTQDILVPVEAFLQFEHNFVFEGENADGGVVEYSIDGGANWLDTNTLMTALLSAGQLYNGVLDAGGQPTFPLALKGRSGFTGNMLQDQSNNPLYDYASTRLDLSSLSGSNIRFRFRVGTNQFGKNQNKGWRVDDIAIYTCGQGSLNVTPTINVVTTEKGGTATLFVSLGFSPKGIVNISVASENPSEGRITTASTLSFSQLNWNVPQNVIVEGVNDSKSDGDKEYYINLSDSNTQDPSLATLRIKITNKDDDDGICSCTLGSNEPMDILLMALLLLSGIYLGRFRKIG